MRKNVQPGVPDSEHQRLTDGPDINWDAVRIFIHVARSGSFRAAAGEAGIAVNTARRHVKTLESQLGKPLVVRGVKGIELTAEGGEVLQAALRMENAAFGVRRRASPGSKELRGRVRISVTEGLGAFWVMPHLVGFQRDNLKLTVEMNCSMRPADPMRLETDIGVQLTRPSNPDVTAVKLGRMHAMPFASREYIRANGSPRSIEDVRQHRVVMQLSPQLFNNRLQELFPDMERDGFVSVITNTSTAHYWAVARGGGLGMLPTYVHAIGGSIVPVEVPITTEFEIWLTYHPDSARVPRIAAAVAWLRSIFDPRSHPWFTDEFVHPNEFENALVGSGMFFEALHGAR